MHTPRAHTYTHIQLYKCRKLALETRTLKMMNTNLKSFNKKRCASLWWCRKQIKSTLTQQQKIKFQQTHQKTKSKIAWDSNRQLQFNRQTEKFWLHRCHQQKKTCRDFLKRQNWRNFEKLVSSCDILLQRKRNDQQKY